VDQWWGSATPSGLKVQNRGNTEELDKNYIDLSSCWPVCGFRMFRALGCTHLTVSSSEESHGPPKYSLSAWESAGDGGKSTLQEVGGNSRSDTDGPQIRKAVLMDGF
jgi:hypothetical protein